MRETQQCGLVSGGSLVQCVDIAIALLRSSVIWGVDKELLNGAYSWYARNVLIPDPLLFTRI